MNMMSQKLLSLRYIFVIFCIPTSLFIFKSLSVNPVEIISDSNHYEKIEVSHCSCDRKFVRRTEKRDIPLSETTCSGNAYARGSGQKVIGFSFYEHNDEQKQKRLEQKARGENVSSPTYFGGIKKNLDLAKQFYPGWVVRLYTDVEEDDPLMEHLCEFSCSYDYFDVCHIENLPTNKFGKEVSKIFPMIWRFFPTNDPQVNLYVCRDLDSKFTEREEAAVGEWLSSGKSIHSMRDHWFHHVPMLGAGWGARFDTQTNIREKWASAWSNILEDRSTYSLRTVKGPDQSVLTANVWPWGKNYAFQHDSYLCKSYPGSVGFPTQRKNEGWNFIAAVGPMRIWRECPEACRRQQDWKYC